MSVDLEVVGADDARDDVGVLTAAQVRDPPQAPRRVQQHLYKTTTYISIYDTVVYRHMESARERERERERERAR